MSSPNARHRTAAGTHKLDENILQRCDRWGNPAALWLVGGILFLLPLIGFSLRGLRMENSIEQWLPASDPQMQALQWFEHEFGKEEMVLAAWEGSCWSDERTSRFAAALRRSLPGRSTGVVNVLTPQEVAAQMVSIGISQEQARNKLTGVLTSPEEQGAIALRLEIDERSAPPQAILQWVQESAELAGIPRADLRLAGGMITRLSLNEAVKRSQWNPQAPWWKLHALSPILLSGLISVVFALVLLKSVRLAGMVLFVSVFSAAIILALIPASGGTVNLLLVVLPSLLIVLTLSGSIRLANYWKHAALENPTTAVWEAIRIAGQPCFLAVLMMVVGMLGLLTSPLGPVRDFGWLSAIGTALSLLLVLGGLPALLILSPPRGLKATSADNRLWSWLGHSLASNHRQVGWSCVIVTGALSAGLIYSRTETKLVRFFPQNSSIVADLEFIEQNICGVAPVDLVVAFGPEARGDLDALQRMDLVRRIEERLLENVDISGAVSLASFQQHLPRPAADAAILTKVRYNKTASEIQARLQEHNSAIHSLAHVSQTPLEVPDAQHPIRIFPESEIWRIKANVATLTDKDYAEIIRDIQAVADGELAGSADTQAFVTGSVPLFLRTQEAVLESLINSLGVAFLLILGILAVQLRGLRAGFLAMLPNVFPITLVFGCVSWSGIPIDLGSMVTASVALGIAINGTVHLLAWFEDGLRRGLTRDEAIAGALAHCGPAMWHTTAIIGFGLLALMGADLLLVSRFGWLMASLVIAALLGDVIYLPAQLGGALGNLIEARVLSERQKVAAEEELALAKLRFTPSSETDSRESGAGSNGKSLEISAREAS